MEQRQANLRIVRFNSKRAGFLAALVLATAISCGSGSSDDTLVVAEAPTSNVSEATPILSPPPAATATPNVVVIEIFPTSVGSPSTFVIGGNEWWNSIAPVGDYRTLMPVLSGTPNGDAIWSLYAATFVASEWLSGREPVPILQLYLARAGSVNTCHITHRHTASNSRSYAWG